MATRNELYAVMISLATDTLLLPNAAVAEVVAGDALIRNDPGHGPEWLIGYYNWNARRVPAVSLEVLNGQPKPPPSRRERLIIVNSLGTKLAGGVIAFLAQSYPHLITLNRAAIRSLPLHPGDRADLVLTRVKIANSEALIPDFETIESELVAAGAG
jgi:chemosensory pili system protein ChpC